MLAAELDLPSYDHIDATVNGERFHEALDELTKRHWLARGVTGLAVLDRDVCNTMLRDRRFAFPALELLELQGVTSGPLWDRTVAGLMVQNGEPHARLRRLLMPAFTPRATERLRPRLRELVAELWEPVAGQGECEFVSTLAEPLPSQAIAELLDTPGDAPSLARWSLLMQELFKFRLHEVGPAVEAAFEEVRAYVFDKLAERRRNPGEDLISVIGATDLTDEECVTLVCSVISGGTDTTQAQLAHGLRLFAENPDQWALLAADPSLAEQAAEEVLRYEPITPFTARVATEDVEIRDVTFPKGTVVFICAATANRDAETFEDPHRFDISKVRDGAPLTFGFGAHYCIGASLARAELVETFGYLAPRVKDLRLAGEPVFGPVTGIYAIESLPIAYAKA